VLIFIKILKKLSFHGRVSPFADKHVFRQLLKTVQGKQWITYSKQPFGGSAQVLEYLGRYTHGVAISKKRIVSIHAAAR